MDIVEPLLRNQNALHRFNIFRLNVFEYAYANADHHANFERIVKYGKETLAGLK